MAPARLAPCLLVLAALASCRAREDPLRVELRALLSKQATLSAQDLTQVLDEVNRSLAGKKVRISQDAALRELDPVERDVVLGMLTDRVGLYDEGPRAGGDRRVRVFNAPGISLHPEYSAARRLFVDIETFLPRRFEFSYEFPGMGDYAFDLLVD